MQDSSKSQGGYESLLVFWGALLVSAVVTYLLSNAIVDDAFIFLKFSENILSLGEFSFNAGEPVNAISSPLYLILILVVRSMGMPGELSLLMLWGLGLTVAITALYFLLSSRSWLIRNLCILALLSQVSMLRSVGMETTWYLAIIISFAYAFEKGSKFWSCLLVAALVLIRLEGFLIIIPLILISLFRRKIAWQEFLTVIVTLGLYTLFCTLYFDNIIPSSIAIKSLQSNLGIWKETSYLEYLSLGLMIPLLSFLIAVFSAPFIFKETSAGKYGVMLIVLFCLTQSVSFIISDAPSHYHWYRVPAYFMLSVCAVYSLTYITQKVLEIKKVELTTTSQKLFIFILLGLILLNIGSEQFKIPPKTYRFSDEYKYISKWLRENTKQDAKVAASEIGYLGYYSRRYIVDKAGLVNPSAVERIMESNSLDWWFNEDELPEYIVEYTNLKNGDFKLEDQWWSEKAKQRFKQIYFPVYSSDQFYVFKKSS